MNCKHPDCAQPIRRCRLRGHGKCWVHTATGWHTCHERVAGQLAEPATGPLPEVSAPVPAPGRVVA